MRIGFYAGDCIPIHARSIEERPLGGTETALIRVAEELSKRGHDVTVLTAMKDPLPSTPRYLFHGRLLEAGPYDLLVVVQHWKAIYYGATYSRLFYWTGDGWDQYANFGIGDQRLVSKIDALLTVSEWHRNTLCERSGFPKEKCKVVGNGVHLPFFEGSEDRQRRRLIYASAPYRGLQAVPPVFNQLRQKYPDLELHVFAGLNVYDREQRFQGPEAEQAKQIAALLEKIPGVTLHGNVLQSQLAREMMKSSILFYPNLIFETCCIVALEAQAAGCPVVASKTSALPETVGASGFLIEGEPGSPEYLGRCFEVLDNLLSDDDLWKRLSHSARARAERELSWSHVADRFEALMNEGYSRAE